MEIDPTTVGHVNPKWFTFLRARGDWMIQSKERNGALSFWQHLKLQFWIELELLRRKWYWALLLVFVLWIHTAFSNYVYYVHMQRGLYDFPTIVDLGFELPGPGIETSDILRQVFYYLAIVPFLFVVVQPFYVVFYPDISKKSRFCVVHLMARYACNYSIAASLRVLSFMVTILPSSGPWCHSPAQGGTYDVNNPSGPQTVVDILFSINLEYGCADMIFSGHTIFVLLCGLTAARYSNFFPFKIFQWLVVPFYAYFTIQSRKHYTVDLLIAIYFVPTLYCAVRDWKCLSEDRDSKIIAEVIKRRAPLPTREEQNDNTLADYETCQAPETDV